MQTLLDHLWEAGLGTISEVFDAAPPRFGAGCAVQAWSVAEALRIALSHVSRAPIDEDMSGRA